MNKTYLIVGGASVASLAVGSVSGYFLAKRKFDASVNEIVAMEVEKTKKFFSLQMMDVNKKPASPADLVSVEDKELDLEGEEQELTEADQKAIEKGRKTLAEAGKALTNYQSFAAKPDLSTLVVDSETNGNGQIVHVNIFSDAETPKKTMPPRGKGGKFVSKADREKKAKEQVPQLLTAEDFLLNELDNEQGNLLYFKEENTLLDLENNNEVVDNAVIGEVNLTLFPSDEAGTNIFVRNEGLGIDYEIRLMTESLTEYLGLGTEEGLDDEDEDELEDEYANQG